MDFSKMEKIDIILYLFYVSSWIIFIICSAFLLYMPIFVYEDTNDILSSFMVFFISGILLITWICMITDRELPFFQKQKNDNFEIVIDENEELLILCEFNSESDLTLLLPKIVKKTLEDSDEEENNYLERNIIEELDKYTFPIKVAFITTTNSEKEGKIKRKVVLEDFIPLVWNWCHDCYCNYDILNPNKIKY